ncbi:MAG: cell division protein ZapA [Lachnospiraceae bacterium]|nr:cell division protein ZapA [Lachnospiraceae bacterium]
MATKNSVQVLIGGKVYTLGGYESDEYLQKVAGYLDQKIAEVEQNENCRNLPYDRKRVLTELNIADDYFKAKKQAELLEEEISSKDKELYDLKHDMIAVQLKLETCEKRLSRNKKELQNAQKKNIQYETELKTYTDQDGKAGKENRENKEGKDNKDHKDNK